MPRFAFGPLAQTVEPPSQPQPPGMDPTLSILNVQPGGVVNLSLSPTDTPGVAKPTFVHVLYLTEHPQSATPYSLLASNAPRGTAMNPSGEFTVAVQVPPRSVPTTYYIQTILEFEN